MRHRTFPCDECLIRADNKENPRSKFPAERWAASSASIRNAAGYGPDMHAPLFGCHKGTPSDPDEDLACAGWLAKFGAGHPTVRLAVVCGGLPVSALEPGENWPPLHNTWDEVVQYQTGRTCLLE